MNEPSQTECSAEKKLSAGNLSAGTVISGFRIEREIGRGGMGVVYLATQLNLQRASALKVLADDLSGNAMFVKRFFQEAHSAASLSHPDIVQAYDAGVFSGLCYYAMEYVDGETLEVRLRRDGALSPRAAAETGRRIACALGYAWQARGMCHGDIKPDNILISRSGELKLADLGLAKSVYDEDCPRDVMVTPLYASPEIISGKVTEPNLLSDIYSFGATVYHAATGTPPFPGDAIKDIYRRHLEEIPRPPSSVNPAVPEALSFLILRMLEKNPENRPSSWSEIEEAFQNMTEEPQAVGRTGKRKNRMVWIPILIFSLLLLLSACFLFVRSAVGVRDTRLVRADGAVSRKASSIPAVSVPEKKEVPRNHGNGKSASLLRKQGEEKPEDRMAETYLQTVESFSRVVRFAPYFDPRKTSEMLKTCRFLTAQSRLPHLASVREKAERQLKTAERILKLRSAAFRQLPRIGKRPFSRKNAVAKKKFDGEAPLLCRILRSCRPRPAELRKKLKDFGRKYRKSAPVQAKYALWIAEAVTPPEGLHPLYSGWNRFLKGLPADGFGKNCEFYELDHEYLWLQFSDGIMRLRRKYPATSGNLKKIREWLMRSPSRSDFWEHLPEAVQRYVVIWHFMENPAFGAEALLRVSDPVLKRDLERVRSLIEKSVP